MREVLWAGFVSTTGAASYVLRAAGTHFKWEAIKEIPSGAGRHQPLLALAASGSLLFAAAPSSTARVGCHMGVSVPPATLCSAWGTSGCSPNAVEPLAWCCPGLISGRLEAQTGKHAGSRHLKPRCAAVLPQGGCWSSCSSLGHVEAKRFDSSLVELDSCCCPLPFLLPPSQRTGHCVHLSSHTFT